MGVIQDAQGVRLLDDIERKYQLGQMKTNLELQRGYLVKVQNELFNTLASLIINLEGLMESQDEISSWFFFGTPGATVEPEINWKDDDFTLPNILVNSDFSDGTSSWQFNSGSGIASNNELEFTVTALSSGARIEQSATVGIVGNKYYMTAKLKHPRAINSVMSIGSGEFTFNTIAGEYTMGSGVVTATSTSRFRFYATSSESVGGVLGEKYYFKDIKIYNLTEMYGAGNEPTKEQMEAIISATQMKADHIGDLYYDKGNGRVYQYQANYTWLENADTRLVQALALTNSDIVGNERKIYFEKPSPPYVNGDWWIQDNGDLWICQVTRGEGYYVDNDFIVSPLYNPGVNSATANQLTILSGAITTIKQGVDSISQVVASNVQMLDSLSGVVTTISENYTSLEQTANAINIAVVQIGADIEDAKENITKIVTTVGYRFDDDGLSISKSNSEMNSLINNTGLYVKRNSDVILEANNEGVVADKMKANELQVGERCVIMDYENGTGLFHRKV